MSYQEFIQHQEENDGVRFSWNVWPHSRLDATRMVVPIGSFYTPLKEKQEAQPSLVYDPQVCQKTSCRAVLNPYCQVDYRAKLWLCNFCGNRNPFPPQYAQMTEQSQPPELLPQFTTIEYTLGRQTTMPPVFLYVVDTCVLDDELKALKTALTQSISLLPPEAFVGLITFGKMISLHDIGASMGQDGMVMPRCYVFRGTKEVTQKQIQDILGFGRGPGTGAPAAPQQQGRPPVGPPGSQPPQQQQVHTAPPGNKFLQPIHQCDMAINDLIDDIQSDPWPVAKGHRPLRAVGAAMSAAVTLLEVCFPNTGARIMLFLGGPCTEGPGLIIDHEQKNVIRSWHDMHQDNARYMRKAIKHYEGLSARAVKNSHAVDIYSCSLDQTGIYEMRSLTESTGGHLILADSFQSSLFTQSFALVFTKDQAQKLKMGFNSVIEVKTSKELRIEGAIGCAANMHVKNASVSDQQEIGLGGTCQWKVHALTPRSTMLFLFDVAAQHGASVAQGQRGYVQFITQYQHADGRKRIRVTTACRYWVDAAQQLPQISSGFDQEASAVLMARLAVWRATSEGDTPDAVRWIDRSLIRLCQKFGQFHKDAPESFQLPDAFGLYPQFMFHLRRSNFLQVFNSSPDETSFYRHWLFTEDVGNQMTMVQPILYSYSFEGPPQPALLDSSSLQPNVILLMDCFFQVLIYQGQHIAAWRKLNYHEQPEYASLKQLMEAPVNDAQEILRDRFPVPRYIETEHDHSQARFLLSRVNPSTTHNNMPWGANPDEAPPIFTDDVSFSVFMEHLKKLSTSSTT